MLWVSVGAAVATAIWLIASIGFSIYSSTVGNYAKTYGVFAGIVVLLLWLWLSMCAILFGAEIDAEAEAALLTIADSAPGAEEPLADATPKKSASAESSTSEKRQHAGKSHIDRNVRP